MLYSGALGWKGVGASGAPWTVPPPPPFLDPWRGRGEMAVEGRDGVRKRGRERERGKDDGPMSRQVASSHGAPIHHRGYIYTARMRISTDTRASRDENVDYAAFLLLSLPHPLSPFIPRPLSLLAHPSVRRSVPLFHQASWAHGPSSLSRFC